MNFKTWETIHGEPPDLIADIFCVPNDAEAARKYAELLGKPKKRLQVSVRQEESDTVTMFDVEHVESQLRSCHSYFTIMRI